MIKYRANHWRVLLMSLVASAGIAIEATALPPAYTVTDLGVAGAENTLGWGINAGGQVTGYASSTVEGDDTVTAFVWKPDTPNSPTGTMHDLDSIGGNFSWGIGINAAGQVSGVSATADGQIRRVSVGAMPVRTPCRD